MRRSQATAYVPTKPSPWRLLFVVNLRLPGEPAPGLSTQGPQFYGLCKE